MLKKDLTPPLSGLAANPVLYGVASGLAKLFPPERGPTQEDTREGARERRDASHDEESE